MPPRWPTEEIEIIWQPCLQPYEISLNYFGKDFVETFKDSINDYLKLSINESDKIFFNTILKQLKNNMQQPTSERQKDMLKKWIQTNANYFNNSGAFDKLYPEFSKLL